MLGQSPEQVMFVTVMFVSVMFTTLMFASVTFTAVIFASVMFTTVMFTTVMFQWSVVGDTFPTGCAPTDSIVFGKESFRDSPDLCHPTYRSAQSKIQFTYICRCIIV